MNIIREARRDRYMECTQINLKDRGFNKLTQYALKSILSGGDQSCYLNNHKGDTRQQQQQQPSLLKGHFHQ